MPRQSEKLSVLMAVYKNDNHEWVGLAIESILGQSHRADEIVVVIDGPISKKLQTCLDTYRREIRQIPLLKNQGLWNALNVGISATKYELVARMDADDISLSGRFEKQLKEFMSDKDLALLGGQVAEFMEDPDKVMSYRKVPESTEDIRRFAKMRSPFNHPTVMFRKSKVLEVGGYHEFYRTEDYDLWTRMLQADIKMRNLPDILLNYRVGHSNYGRKNSKIQHEEAIILQKKLLASGFLSWYEYFIARITRGGFYYLPSSLKRLAYRKILRT